MGAETFNTLSASSANLFYSMVTSVEARTLAGSRWRNNSRRKELLSADPNLSPRSCCIRRRSCVGLRSPSSSPLFNCCSFALFRGGSSFDELGLEDVVQTIVGGLQQKVTHLHGDVRVEGADDVVELSLLGCDTPASELSFDLREPYFGVGRPELWQLNADCCKSHGDAGGRFLLYGGSSSVVVTNVVLKTLIYAHTSDRMF